MMSQKFWSDQSNLMSGVRWCFGPFELLLASGVWSESLLWTSTAPVPSYHHTQVAQHQHDQTESKLSQLRMKNRQLSL